MKEYTSILLDKFLKKSLEKDQQVIQRNTDIVQKPVTKICGHCLFVLETLKNGMIFRD